MQIIILDKTHWQKYKKIRLEALKNEPTAFLRTYEEESKKTDNMWKERLEEAQNENKVILLFVEQNDKIIGMGGLYYEKEDSSVVNIWGIYINKEFRGKGFGKELINSLLNKTHNNLKVGVIRLEVNAENLPAINLYKRLEFRIVEKKVKSLHGKYDEYVMEKLVS